MFQMRKSELYHFLFYYYYFIIFNEQESVDGQQPKRLSLIPLTCFCTRSFCNEFYADGSDYSEKSDRKKIHCTENAGCKQSPTNNNNNNLMLGNFVITFYIITKN